MFRNENNWQLDEEEEKQMEEELAFEKWLDNAGCYILLEVRYDKEKKLKYLSMDITCYPKQLSDHNFSVN